MQYMRCLSLNPIRAGRVYSIMQRATKSESDNLNLIHTGQVPSVRASGAFGAVCTHSGATFCQRDILQAFFWSFFFFPVLCVSLLWKASFCLVRNLPLQGLSCLEGVAGSCSGSLGWGRDVID